MPIRMTGMFSGLDTDTLIQSMVEAQRKKNKSTTDKKTKLEWKQEKWKDLNTKLYNLYTNQVGALRLQKNYLTKKTTVSDETKVSIKADKDAPEGSHQVSVSQLASSQYVTSGKIDKEGFSTSTKLTELGFEEGRSVVTIKNGDKQTQLYVNSSTTVKDFISTCKDAGLTASYDEKQKRFFISSEGSGVENQFTITTGTLTADGAAARENIVSLLNMADSTTASSANSCLVKLQSGDEAKVKEASEELVKLAKSSADAEAQSKATGYYKKILTETTVLTDAEKEQIAKKYENYTDEESKAKKIEADEKKALEKKINDMLDSNEYKLKIKEAVENGLSADKVGEAIGSSDPDEIAKYTFEDKTTRSVTMENAMNQAITQYKDLYAAGTGETASLGTSPLAALGLGEITDVSSDKSASETGGYTLIAAKNSIITYNGVEIEDSSNSISVNGLTIDIKGVTTSPVSCSVSNDTEGTYKMIKDFVKEYNSIIKEMNELYYADSARGYEPLDDDEKEAMTDDQIEKWETKIKDSLLRRDSTMNSIMTAMKSALQSTVTIDGKNYSLASLGIKTSSDYTEKGLLHIYGDPDDPVFKEQENKLEKMLAEDPDKVMKIMSGVAKNLYQTMADKMKKTSISSALTFYNDKDINKQIDDLNKKIKKQEKALTELEDKYYKQFSAMETALAKLQSQQSQLQGMLGM